MDVRQPRRRLSVRWVTLCKSTFQSPGGHREGPYTLDQIIQDLAAKKYSDTDFWAWHEGMTDWVPLYELPGIAADDEAAPAAGGCAAPDTNGCSAQSRRRGLCGLRHSAGRRCNPA